MRQALFKCETPRLKLKSSRSFLAIKRWQRTKSKKVIKHLRSSKLRWEHICAHSRIPVKPYNNPTITFPFKLLSRPKIYILIPNYIYYILSVQHQYFKIYHAEITATSGLVVVRDVPRAPYWGPRGARCNLLLNL